MTPRSSRPIPAARGRRQARQGPISVRFGAMRAPNANGVTRSMDPGGAHRRQARRRPAPALTYKERRARPGRHGPADDSTRPLRRGRQDGQRRRLVERCGAAVHGLGRLLAIASLAVLFQHVSFTQSARRRQPQAVAPGRTSRQRPTAGRCSTTSSQLGHYPENLSSSTVPPWSHGHARTYDSSWHEPERVSNMDTSCLTATELHPESQAGRDMSARSALRAS